MRWTSGGAAKGYHNRERTPSAVVVHVHTLGQASVLDAAREALG